MLSMVMDSTSMIILGTYFWIFNTMEPILIGSVLVTLIILILIMVYVPESPKFLYDKGRMSEFN